MIHPVQYLSLNSLTTERRRIRGTSASYHGITRTIGLPNSLKKAGLHIPHTNENIYSPHLVVQLIC